MIVVLPYNRQPYQLLANNFAAGEKLEKSGKRNAPVLEIEKAGVLILNKPTCSFTDGALILKGVML
jgi:hypothetical protein